MNKLIVIAFLFFAFSYMFSPNATPPPQQQNLSDFITKYEKIEFTWINIPQTILFGFGLISLFWLSLIYSCNHVKYVNFSTNLNLFKKKSIHIFPPLSVYLWLMLSGLLLCEYPEDFFSQFFMHFHSNFAFSINLDHKGCKRFARSCFHVCCVFIFTDAMSPETHILSIFVLQIW